MKREAKLLKLIGKTNLHEMETFKDVSRGKAKQMGLQMALSV